MWLISQSQFPVRQKAEALFGCCHEICPVTHDIAMTAFCVHMMELAVKAHPHFFNKLSESVCGRPVRMYVSDLTFEFPAILTSTELFSCKH